MVAIETCLKPLNINNDGSSKSHTESVTQGYCNVLVYKEFNNLKKVQKTFEQF